MRGPFAARDATEPGRSSFVLRSYSSPVPSPPCGLLTERPLPTTLRLATLPTGLSLCSLPTPSRPVSPLRSPYAPFVRSLSRRAEGRDGARLTLLTASGSLVTPVVVSPLVSHRPHPDRPHGSRRSPSLHPYPSHPVSLRPAGAGLRPVTRVRDGTGEGTEPVETQPAAVHRSAPWFVGHPSRLTRYALHSPPPSGARPIA